MSEISKLQENSNQIFTDNVRWLLYSGIRIKNGSNKGAIYGWKNLNPPSYPFIYSEITGYAITSYVYIYSELLDYEALSAAKDCAYWLIQNISKNISSTSFLLPAGVIEVLTLHDRAVVDSVSSVVVGGVYPPVRMRSADRAVDRVPATRNRAQLDRHHAFFAVVGSGQPLKKHPDALSVGLPVKPQALEDIPFDLLHVSPIVARHRDQQQMATHVHVQRPHYGLVLTNRAQGRIRQRQQRGKVYLSLLAHMGDRYRVCPCDGRSTDMIPMRHRPSFPSPGDA